MPSYVHFIGRVTEKDKEKKVILIISSLASVPATSLSAAHLELLSVCLLRLLSRSYVNCAHDDSCSLFWTPSDNPCHSSLCPFISLLSPGVWHWVGAPCRQIGEVKVPQDLRGAGFKPGCGGWHGLRGGFPGSSVLTGHLLLFWVWLIECGLSLSSPTPEDREVQWVCRHPAGLL